MQKLKKGTWYGDMVEGRVIHTEKGFLKDVERQMAFRRQ